jgi:papain like protease
MDRKFSSLRTIFFFFYAFFFTLPLHAEQPLQWELVGRPAGARDISVSHDGTIYLLKNDKSLWVSDMGGRDGSWRKRVQLPAETDGITASARFIFFQKKDRTLWYVDRKNQFHRAGNPQAAVDIAGTEDSTLDFPILYALHDDKTFWINDLAGIDGHWTKTGRSDAANKFAATSNALFALHSDGSLWINRNQGAYLNWQPLGEAPAAKTIAANDEGQSDIIRLYTLDTDDSLRTSTIVGVVGDSLAPTSSRVDLRAKQTSLKNQGGRGTCITFAAIAALEAAYKRAGYGDLNLSEEFANHFHKMFWLHPYWNMILERGEDGHETQVGAFSGGGGVGYLLNLSKGLRVPLEQSMPYRNTDYRAGEFNLASANWEDPVFKKQRSRSDFNLHSDLLKDAVLKAKKYFSIQEYTKLGNPNDPDKFEEVLRDGYEIVWDFNVMTAASTNDIWRPCTADCPGGAHSMLIVGYDKTDSDPMKHYFIVKNSWGPTQIFGASGYTYISYDYVRKNGTAAGYINAVNPPGPWPELAFVGRWHLDFDGHRGMLDIYHLPGVGQYIFEMEEYQRKDPTLVNMQDRRIGSFYDADGKAYKVNGSINGNYIEFYINHQNPKARWDKLEGRKFRYYLNSTRDLMTGFHTDPDGSRWGGYGVKADFLPSGQQTPRPFNGNSYANSTWQVVFGNYEGTLRFTNQELTGTITRVKGQFIELSSSRLYDATAVLRSNNPQNIRISISSAAHGRNYVLEGKHLSHEPGLIAGVISAPRPGSFYMIRQ